MGRLSLLALSTEMMEKGIRNPTVEISEDLYSQHEPTQKMMFLPDLWICVRDR